MSCCGDREKLGQTRLEQTWDYINLNDFKSSSCFTGFSYFMVWFFLVVSIAVYAVDTFTAVNLLVFSRWSSQIKPKIPFKISKWIFAGCIIASFVLLAMRWIRTIRVMRSDSIAESYLDPLAVRVQSIRVGKSKGYRRFLVFAELTKSKKGADYVALFAYFSFEAWLRIVFADGPRQVLNAITLYSVLQLNLIPEGSHAAPDGTSPVAQFFINIKALAEKNYQQAVILFGMLFTLIIWVIAALSLLISVILYLIFLWHHIPSEDGSLKRYCRRKINRRLDRIVRKKTAKALAHDVQLKDRTPTMPLTEGEELKPVKMAPTLPSLQEYPEDKKPIVTVAPLSRQTTQTTLPSYSSQAGRLPSEEDLHQQPTLPDLGGVDRPWLTKTNTQNSAYSESASMTANAEPMGYSPLDHQQSHMPPLPPVPFDPNMGRSYSPAMNRPRTTQGGRGPMPMEGPGRRTPGSGYSQPPSSMGLRTPGYPQGDNYGQGPMSGDNMMSGQRPYGASSSRPYSPANTPAGGPPFSRANFAPDARSYTPAYGPAGDQPPPRIKDSAHNRPYSPANTPANAGPYTAFSPANNTTHARSFTPANDPPGHSLPPLNTTVPSPQTDPVNRSYTPGSGTASPNPQNNGAYQAFNPFATPANDETPSHPAPVAPSQPIVRPSTTAPTHTAPFQGHASNPRAATASPSHAYGRRPPQHNQTQEEDEYDPLSYYGGS
ncbi:putative vacuolar membrane protein YJR054W [Talaromyces islandicus]|uniref:Putative vacuolar membrane protein YJR054W n=1 Tax=Talaromyces islandicus TaxID=28573 RepID=A0A0U1LP22_TALIS|nr:putative vacuolar membrane protein YJR054W [Talaromyces islandicus]